MCVSGVERSQVSSQKKVTVSLLVRTKEIFLEGVELFSIVQRWEGLWGLFTKSRE